MDPTAVATLETLFMHVVLGVLLAEPKSAAASVPVRMVASAAMRECGVPARASSGLWERARVPQLIHYCDLLAQAEVQLSLAPAKAAETALHADELLPGRAAPLVLRARAASALGRYHEAVAWFQQAQALDGLAVDQAPSLFAFATSLRAVGNDAGAVQAYRALVPQSALLPTALMRGRALCEASMAIAQEGPSAVEEALAVLRVAYDASPAAMHPVVDALLMLLLDRKGAHAEAHSRAAQAIRLGALKLFEADSEGSRNSTLSLQPQDRLAVLAELREDTGDATGAAAAWNAFLAGPGGSSPWAAHAQARIAKLQHTGGGTSHERGGKL